MLGIPLTADVRFPADSPALFLTYHAAADPDLERSLGRAIEQGKPILLTSTLRDRLSERLRKRLSGESVRVLDLDDKREKSFYGVLDSVRRLMELPRQRADALRAPLLKALGVKLSAPPRVSIYLFGQRKVVLENFNDRQVSVRLAVDGAKAYRPAIVLPTGADVRAKSAAGEVEIQMPPRSLVALLVQ